MSPVMEARPAGMGASGDSGVPLTIGHEPHNGMGGATQVGRGALVCNDSKQGDGTIGGEAKHSSQYKNPELQGPCGIVVRHF